MGSKSFVNHAAAPPDERADTEQSGAEKQNRRRFRNRGRPGIGIFVAPVIRAAIAVVVVGFILIVSQRANEDFTPKLGLAR